MTNDARMYAIPEIAQILHVSERTVKRRIADGDLAAHKLGRQWRITKHDLESYLIKHRRGGDRGVL